MKGRGERVSRDSVHNIKEMLKLFDDILQGVTTALIMCLMLMCCSLRRIDKARRCTSRCLPLQFLGQKKCRKSVASLHYRLRSLLFHDTCQRG